jgi:chitodextrinase
LSWTASTDTHGTLAGYYVYRGGIQIGSSATASYVDTSTSGFTTYNYSIAAYDTAHPANVSAQSVPFTITTPDTIAPTVPTGLTKVSASSTQVVISWSASTDTGGSGLAGYRIYRGGTQIGTSGAATYTDTTVGGTTTYSYTVAAYDNAGNVSAKSSALMVTTPDTIPPSVPGFYFVTAVSTTEVNLSWSTSVDTGGSGLAGYKLYRNGALVTTQVGTTYSDSGLVAGTTYYYQVAAYDNAGNVSALSAAGYVTTPTGITDSPQLTVGVQGEGGISFEGFSLGAYGSITPGKTSTGFTYQAFADKYATSQPGYVSTIFSMSGFTSDPGQAWLTLAVAEGHAFSGNTASYFYSAGIASWTWTTGPAFTSGGTVPCTVVHQ